MAQGEWHDVVQGEWLSKICVEHNFSDTKTIWDHPNNSDLRKLRNSNILFPGDRIFIPSPVEREESCSTDSNHRFRVKRLWDTFQLQILDGLRRPLKNQQYTLVIGSQRFKGTTDGNGHLRHTKIDPRVNEPATLDFPRVGLTLRIPLGNLNPAHEHKPGESESYDNGISGVQMRLANLGYEPGNIAGVMDSRTVSAIVMFQVFEMNRSADNATGVLDAETRDALIGKHKS